MGLTAGMLLLDNSCKVHLVIIWDIELKSSSVEEWVYICGLNPQSLDICIRFVHFLYKTFRWIYNRMDFFLYNTETANIFLCNVVVSYDWMELFRAVHECWKSKGISANSLVWLGTSNFRFETRPSQLLNYHGCE